MVGQSLNTHAASQPNFVHIHRTVFSILVAIQKFIFNEMFSLMFEYFTQCKYNLL